MSTTLTATKKCGGLRVKDSWKEPVAAVRKLLQDNPGQPFSADKINELLGFQRDRSTINDYIKRLKNEGLYIQVTRTRGASGYYLADGNPLHIKHDDSFKLSVKPGDITVSRKRPGASDLIKLSATPDEWAGVLPSIMAAIGIDPSTIEKRLTGIEHALTELLSRPVVPVPGSVPGNAGMPINSDVPAVPGNHSGTGNKRIEPPSDTGPLTEAVKTAAETGAPFNKTGAKGVYARSSELPPAFRIGRNRLENIVAGLIQAGEIIQDATGALSVPVPNSQ